MRLVHFARLVVQVPHNDLGLLRTPGSPVLVCDLPESLHRLFQSTWLPGLLPPTQGLGRPRSIHLNYRARIGAQNQRLLVATMSILDEREDRVLLQLFTAL